MFIILKRCNQLHLQIKSTPSKERHATHYRHSNWPLYYQIENKMYQTIAKPVVRKYSQKLSDTYNVIILLCQSEYTAYILIDTWNVYTISNSTHISHLKHVHFYISHRTEMSKNRKTTGFATGDIHFYIFYIIPTSKHYIVIMSTSSATLSMLSHRSFVLFQRFYRLFLTWRFYYLVYPQISL